MPRSLLAYDWMPGLREAGFFRPDSDGGRIAQVNGADGKNLSSTGGTSEPRCAQSVIGPEFLAGSGRHGDGDLFADRSVLGEHAFGDFEHLNLGVVVVANRTAVKNFGDTGNLGEGGREQAPRTGLGNGQSFVERSQFPKNDLGKRAVAQAHEILTDCIPAGVRQILQGFLGQYFAVQGTETDVDHSGMGAIAYDKGFLSFEKVLDFLGQGAFSNPSGPNLQVAVDLGKDSLF